jgi:phosphonate transport system ATP-binding protein
MAAKEAGVTMLNGAVPCHEAPSGPSQAASDEAQSAVLRAEGVSKNFGDRQAISQISFTLGARELVAVLGPSGAGKTTLFRCLTGLLKPDEGQIWFGALDATLMRSRGRHIMAVVFQDYNLVRRLTAFENVLGGRLGHVSPWRGILRRFERADKLKAFECLERVGMLEHAHDRADRLSGGQQQRVAIARALAQEARIIVADEPIASLDPASATGVLQLLQTIVRSEGVAVICSLHQVAYARAFSDRIIGLTGGRVVLDAATKTLVDENFAALYTPGTSSQQLSMMTPPDQAHDLVPFV